MERPTLVFISQPMSGRSREGIERERKLIMDDLPGILGVDSVEEQVLIARRKGGIGDSEKYSLYRFEVERHV